MLPELFNSSRRWPLRQKCFGSVSASRGCFSQADLAALAARMKVQTAEEAAQELAGLKKLTPFQAKAIYRGQQKALVLGS